MSRTSTPFNIFLSPSSHSQVVIFQRRMDAEYTPLPYFYCTASNDHHQRRSPTSYPVFTVLSSSEHTVFTSFHLPLQSSPTNNPAHYSSQSILPSNSTRKPYGAPFAFPLPPKWASIEIPRGSFGQHSDIEHRVGGAEVVGPNLVLPWCKEKKIKENMQIKKSVKEN